MRHKQIIVGVVLLLLVIGASWYFFVPRAEPGAAALAECLRDKGVTMYGSATCIHCLKQKKLFGSAFSLVPYVECPDNPQMCLAKGIQGFPTWVMPDGRKLEGEQSFAALSSASGCTLPQ
ncbi:MAG: hypothetical protein HY978_02015 [Candidatus Liptonbacteria bacterium]|nr:hypothetical protein [Candidatus Liptonbacteria bacterium]